jgi:deoxycytidine triphosphate deaminase
MCEAIYMPESHIGINPYEEKNHISNFYYFRLGEKHVEDNATIKNGNLIIPKNGFVRVFSLEQFKLSRRVMAMLGNRSTLVEQGLQLIHSPTIDPGYPDSVLTGHPGYLILGIRNNTSKDVRLPLEERIGKILFYDISDTMINIEEFHLSQLWQKEQSAKKEGLIQGYTNGAQAVEESYKRREKG